MSNELIINASLPETRIALLENGEIQELLIERASGKGIVGNIYKGKVTRVLPGMQAAFVDIGLEKAAFLYVDDVYVHPEVWEDQEEQPLSVLNETGEGEVPPTPSPRAPIAIKPVDHNATASATDTALSAAVIGAAEPEDPLDTPVLPGTSLSPSGGPGDSEVPVLPLPASAPQEELFHTSSKESQEEIQEKSQEESENDLDESLSADWISDVEDYVHENDDRDDAEDDEDDDEPKSMGAESDDPPGTVGPGESVPSHAKEKERDQEDGAERSASGNRNSDGSTEDSLSEGDQQSSGSADGKKSEEDPRRKHRRGRRGNRFRRRPAQGSPQGDAAPAIQPVQQKYPENYHEQIADVGNSDSDRSGLVESSAHAENQESEGNVTARPEERTSGHLIAAHISDRSENKPDHKSEFKSPRNRDRRIRTKPAARPVKAQINIQDLLKEGQEVLVQVAKDPIATKGARLTCHISLPGRHLVCMPTIDHVGVSRRIERDDERRRLREYVERNRTKNLGFIVRTASGKQQSEKRIKQDIDYLTRLWSEIREKAASVTAPALVYEDLNSVLRAIRDWVTEEIDKVIVDSRYHFNEIQRFVSHFMPSLKQKVELYHGDIPIFDAYGISTELSRALERKVWLKSGGYIVVDQAEALVAIDVNTGRYVGKKNLEDTILKTNLEAVQEIAYQLRLRNCGGIIILDLIDMEKDENKQRVYRALEDALSRDRARPTILKISELGLVEMTRKRTRDTIIRTLCESCTHCEGKGFIKSKQTVAYEVMREVEREGIDREVSKILVQAHPDVIDILAIDERDTLDQLERKYRKLIYLQSMTEYHPEQFEVIAEKRDRAERHREPQGREHSQNQRFHKNRSNEAGPIPTIIAVSGAASGENQNVSVKANEGSARDSEGRPTPVITPLITPLVTPLVTPVLANSGDAAETISPGNRALSEGDHSDEEDRLAFLRAQAAQDAALARLSNPNASTQANRTPGGDPSRGEKGARRNTRGRRNNNPGGGPGAGAGGNQTGSGKFRRNFDRRGVKQFGYYPNSNRTNTLRDPNSAGPIIEPVSGGLAQSPKSHDNDGDADGKFNVITPVSTPQIQIQASTTPAAVILAPQTSQVQSDPTNDGI